MLDDRQTIKLPDIDVSTGWALNVVIAFDEIAPGLAGAYLRSSPRRRQVVHAAFARMPSVFKAAQRPIPGAAVELIDPVEAWALLNGRERAIIEHYYGECPAGYLKALGKLGAGAHWPKFYLRLFDVFVTAEDKITARALAHLDRIDQDRLAVAKLLPPQWRLPGVISKLDCPENARKFLRSLNIIRQWSPDATDAAIAEGIRRIGRNSSPASFIANWVRRSRFGSGPLSDSDAIRQIRYAEDLERTGVRMRNCLKDQIGDVLARTSVYYLIMSLDQPVIVHLNRNQPDAPWALEDFYIRSNRRLPEDLREQAEQVLRAHGFDPHRRHVRTRSDIETIKAYLWDAEWERRAA